PEVADQEHRALTLTHAYWPSAPECPAFIKRSKMAAMMKPGTGYVLVHAAEWNPDGPATQYRSFTQDAGKEFLFQSDGRADVRGRFWGTLTNGPDEHEIAIVIAPEEYAKMEPGADYVLVPQNKEGGKPWKTQGRLRIKREE